MVLARADIASIDPQEFWGCCSPARSQRSLPGLELGARRVRSMPGGGDQTRIDLATLAARDAAVPRHDAGCDPAGAAGGGAGVVGDDGLTAGTIDGVLDSARWRS